MTPVAAALLIVLAAQQGEQQRTGQVLTCILDRARSAPHLSVGAGQANTARGRATILVVTGADDLDLVRESYDRVADNYVHMVDTTGLGDVRTQPWMKAAMDLFADAAGPLGPVLDVGCGPGTVTAYLVEKGVDATGVDLSPRMIEHARRRYPDCRFSVGSATGLDLPDRSLGGILGWWSLFNLPRDVLPGVLQTMTRALLPGGRLMIATHVGDGDRHRTEAYGGVPVRWTTHLWQPEQLISMIEGVGLRLVADLRLPPEGPIGPVVVLSAQRDH